MFNAGKKKECAENSGLSSMSLNLSDYNKYIYHIIHEYNVINFYNRFMMVSFQTCLSPLLVMDGKLGCKK